MTNVRLDAIDRRMMSMREACEYTAIPYSTWTKHYLLWQVPHYKVGRRIWFRECELEEWLQEHRREVPQVQLLSTSLARSNAFGRKWK